VKPPPRRNTLSFLVLAVVGVLVIVAGCTSGASAGSATEPTDASGVVKQLGQVPIPTAPATDPTPTASPGHPQLLAMGAPVQVTLAAATATVNALGPDVVLPKGGAAPPRSTTGTITFTATVVSGTLTLRAADFTSRDETGQAVRLTASGPATATAKAGQTATLRLSGTFRAGAAQVTWRDGGSVLALWDFNVELD